MPKITSKQLIERAFEYLADDDYEVHVSAGKVFREPKEKPPTLREFFFIWLPEQLGITPAKMVEFIYQIKDIWERDKETRTLIINVFLARIERMVAIKNIEKFIELTEAFNVNFDLTGEQKTIGLLPSGIQLKDLTNGSDNDNS